MAEAKAGDFFRIAPFAQHVQQFDESLFALAAHHPVDIGCVQYRFGIEAGEIPAPDRGNIGISRLDLLGETDGAGQLRAGHHGKTDRAHRILRTAPGFDDVTDPHDDIHAGQIPIHDFPVFAFGDRSADSHDGKGKAPVARPGSAGIDQDDHDG